MSDKRRLTINEIKQVIDASKYNSNYGYHIDGQQYNLDDVYNQYVDMHDIAMGMLDDLILKRNR